MFLAIVKPFCSRTKHFEEKRLTANSEVKTNAEKTKGAQEWLNVTGKKLNGTPREISLSL